MHAKARLTFTKAGRWEESRGLGGGRWPAGWQVGKWPLAAAAAAAGGEVAAKGAHL